MISIRDIHLGDQEVDPSKVKLLICDIDGTVADLKHRRHFVENHPKNWAAFNERIHLDKPINWVIDIVNEFYKQGSKVVMLSGREGTTQIRKKTKDWLLENGVLHDGLYMRQEKDYRGDDIIKLELLDLVIREYGLNPDLVLDDRDRVVKAWRGNGYRCIQVAEGDF